MYRVAAFIFALSLVVSGCADCGIGNTEKSTKKDDAGTSYIPIKTDGAVVDISSAQCQDEDGDHYGAGCTRGPDCVDDDPEINPGQPEICDDGINNDCDDTTADDNPDQCSCKRNDQRACYTGPADTEGKGQCQGGIQLCDDNGAWGDCLNQILPEVEICGDHIDNNCDDQQDENLLNACGECGTVPQEVCGNDLDDNCDNTIDEGCDCDPGCLCSGGGCECNPPTNQPCYTGPPSTANVGACHHGTHDCVDQGAGAYAWSICSGEQLPAEEICGDGVDNDCDGLTDEADCTCVTTGSRPCGSDIGQCTMGTQLCSNGTWGACENATEPVAEQCNGLDDNCDGVIDDGVKNACGFCGAPPEEVCDDGLDNNCNNQVDEPEAGCGCSAGDTQGCYRGPIETRMRGLCRDGTQQCVPMEVSFWGTCSGDILPAPERCDDNDDNDCDGEVNEGCICQDGQTRPCGETDVGACQMGIETCSGGQWGTCTGAVGPTDEQCNGVDDNCNGQIDDNLLNACGRCPNTNPPCFSEPYTFPNDSGRGESDGVSTNPQNPLDPRCAGQAICLDSAVSNNRFMWIAGTNKWADDSLGCNNNDGTATVEAARANLALGCSRTVLKMDTQTGDVVGVYPSHGWFPSRTAVNTDDGSVWVGNRGRHAHVGDVGIWMGNDIRAGSVVHLNSEGEVICRADMTDPTQSAEANWCGVRAVALDANMDVWVGMWNQAKVYKISGSQINGDDGYGLPKCRTIPIGANGEDYLDIADSQGTSRAYGMAIVNDRLWMATLGHGPIRVIDTTTATIDKTIVFGTGAGQVQCTGLGTDGVERVFTPSTYGMAVDRLGNAWYGLWNDSSFDVHGTVRINSDGLTCDYFANSYTDTMENNRSRGVAIDANDAVWVANWDKDSVSKYDINGAHLGTYSIKTATDFHGPLGIGVDSENHVWAVNYSGKNATKLLSDGSIVGIYGTENTNAYTYSDFTGMQNSLITRRNGTWTLTFDSGYASPRWRTVTWTGDAVPPTTSIDVAVRSAANEAGLTGAWSSTYSSNPADITGAVPDERWLQVRLTLRTQDDAQTPVLQGVTVDWEY